MQGSHHFWRPMMFLQLADFAYSGAIFPTTTKSDLMLPGGDVQPTIAPPYLLAFTRQRKQPRWVKPRVTQRAATEGDDAHYPAKYIITLDLLPGLVLPRVRVETSVIPC